ncbi:MAG: putative quinol monooxygenase [Bacteroidales bacterium]
MIEVQVKIEVKLSNKAELLNDLEKLAIASRLETGCISYNVYANAYNETELFIFEEWENTEVLTLHEASAHFSQGVVKLNALAEKVDLNKRNV